jgi:hypothetical protein
MVLLQLATEDATLLREILESRLDDLAREINRTDHLELKSALKARERAIERLIRQLSSESARSVPVDTK